MSVLSTFRPAESHGPFTPLDHFASTRPHLERSRERCRSITSDSYLILTVRSIDRPMPRGVGCRDGSEMVRRVECAWQKLSLGCQIAGKLTPCVSPVTLSNSLIWKSNEGRVPVALLKSPEHRDKLAQEIYDRVRWCGSVPAMESIGVVLGIRPSFSEQPYYGTVPLERGGM